MGYIIIVLGYTLLRSGQKVKSLCKAATETKMITFMDCTFQKCYIVNDNDYFTNVTEYNAILFNAIRSNNYTNTPIERSDHQIYVFVSTEPTRYLFF